MKILLITEFFPTGKDLRFSGGVEARTFFLAKNLAKKHQVTVLSSRVVRTPKKEKILGFTVYRIGPTRNYSASAGHLISRLRFVVSAIRFGKNLEADIIDSGNYISHFIARKIADYKNIPVVAWYPDVWLSEWLANAGLYGVFGELLERYNLKSRFDAYIAISRETSRKLKRYAKSKVHTIYCGVDSSEFIINVKKYRNPTILCVSRLARYKNIKTLVLAFAHLNRKHPNARLLIVGEGPEKNNLIKLVNNLNLKRKVKMISNLPRKELIITYKSSHVFALPSLVEGFGIATIEAARAGLPYVNSNIPIQVEVTKRGLGGFLVDPANPLQYSEKLSLLLENREVYARKRSETLKLARIYDWNAVSSQTEKIYKSLI